MNIKEYLNTTTMASLGFIGPPLKISFPPPPPQLFWSEIFRSPPTIGGGGDCYHDRLMTAI